MAAISSAPRPRAESASATHKPSWLIRLLLTLALIACDALAVNSALVAVYLWRFVAGDLDQFVFPDRFSILMFMSLLNAAFAINFFVSGLYSLKRGASRVDEAFKVVTAISLGMFAGIIINTLLPGFGRATIPVTALIQILGWAAAIVVTIMIRLIYRSFVSAMRQRGFDNRRILIIGARESGRVVNNTIQREPGLGYRVQGFLSDTVPVGTVVDGVPVLGKTAALDRVIRVTRADEVIIALSGRSSGEILDILMLADDEAVEIKLYPDVFQLITNNEVSTGDVSGLPLISIKNVALDNPVNQALKRALDLVVAALVLTLLSPILLLIAVLIRLESPGPVFFVQERVGLDGKPFPMIKFRGMRQDAEEMGTWTQENDPRVTTLGSILRRYSLDELPQFINVLRGEMSVVGPRPEQPKYVEEFSQRIPRYVRRHKQKAGITGWAQINGLRGDTSIEERTRYDLYYVENWSLLFDIKIIINTAIDTVTGKLKGY